MKKNVLLIATGAPAIIKTSELRDLLHQDKNFEVRVMTSEYAKEHFEYVNGLEPYYFDGSIEYRHEMVSMSQWADIIVVYPATVNTMAKINSGIADGTITNIILTAKKPTIFFPSANINMIRNAIKRKNFESLEKNGMYVVGPNIRQLNSETQVAEIISPKQAFNYIKNFAEPKNIKVVIMHGNPQTSNFEGEQVENLSTPAALLVLKKAFEERGAIVEALDVSFKNNNKVFDFLVKNDWDILVSTINYVDYIHQDDQTKTVSVDLRESYDVFGHIRRMFRERIIVGFKYSETEKDALDKMRRLSLNGMFWNKLSLMTPENITGKFFYDNEQFQINNISKMAGAEIIAGVTINRLIKNN